MAAANAPRANAARIAALVEALESLLDSLWLSHGDAILTQSALDAAQGLDLDDGQADSGEPDGDPGPPF